MCDQRMLKCQILTISKSSVELRYKVELDDKIEIPWNSIDNCNDGRRKNFFCMAVNLLEVNELIMKTCYNFLERYISIIKIKPKPSTK